jgi:hypothetical protein
MVVCNGETPMPVVRDCRAVARQQRRLGVVHVARLTPHKAMIAMTISNST